MDWHSRHVIKGNIQTMLKDVLKANLDVIFCGTAKGKTSAKKGFYYAGSGNQFYGILYRAGFTTKRLEPKDCYEINTYNIGLTDLVSTEFGNDNEISDESYDIQGFITKIKKYQPKYIAFNSKKAASFVLGFKGITKLVEYSLQQKTIGLSQIYVLPSTSGSARAYWDEKYWIELRKMTT